MGSKPLELSNSEISGGGKRDRTDDLLHAMQALSQLSYTPIAKVFYNKNLVNF
jgi:hypothetical protein